MPFITICVAQEYVIMILRVNIQFQAFGVCRLLMRIFSDNMAGNFVAEY